MITKIKKNIKRFFLRLKLEKEIKQIESDLCDLSWTIGVEKNDSDEVLNMYYEVRELLSTKKIELNNLYIL